MITKRTVSEDRRPGFLGRHMPNQMMGVIFEQMAFNMAQQFSTDYTGDYWDFYTLSNGGFYMTPRHKSPFRVLIDTNGWSGELSSDAYGIVLTLFALSHLSFQFRHEGIGERFQQLREFISQEPPHAELQAILGAID